MKYELNFLKTLVCIVTSLTLAGCAGVTVVPDSSVNPTATSVGAITGSNYGGHAPLVGAHIYLVQPGTTGYGSQVTNLLTTNANASTYPLITNGSWPAANSGGNTSDQFVPLGFNGITTNVNGEFALSGDYTCVAGLPVILIGYGGYPSFVPTTTAGTNTFSVTNATELNNGSTGFTFTYTVATTATNPELFYPGESVSVTGAPSISAGFNNSGTVIGDSTLTTTTFSIFVAYGSNPNLGNGTPTNLTSGNIGQTVTATPAFNPAATNMAVLGNCPSNGTFATGPSAIKYVYMNEVSTTAAAYAFSPFANWAQNDQNGNDEFHIGAPSTNLVGLQNAAVTAGALYDIQGGNTAVSNPDGDVHTARTTTPSGTGTVPQTLINTIGNILASCVDSNNTYRLGAGVKSSQCQTLGFYATDNGVYDTTQSTTHQAFNIAQAAMNMARFPQGNGTGSSSNCNGFNYCTTQTITSLPTSTTASAYTQALFNLPTGNVPFTAALSAVPNDFSIAIQWSDATANGGTVTNGVASGGAAVATTDLAVDASGNVWQVSPTYNVTGGVFQFSPLTGLYTAYTAPLSQNNPGIAIDVNGNAWVPGLLGGAYKFTPGVTTGSVFGLGYGIASESIALDTGSVYMVSNGNNSNAALIKQSQAGAAAGGNFPIVGVNGPTYNTAGGCLAYGQYLTVDAVGNIWTASTDANGYVPYNAVCEFNNAGTLIYSYFYQPAGTNTGNPFPHTIETDANNNAWFADKNNSFLEMIPAGLSTANNNTGLVKNSGGSLAAPKGIAIDGANTIWVSNQNAGIVHYTSANVSLSGTKYIGGGTTTDLIYDAVDPSGSVWASAPNEGQLVQFVGVAAPTVTPISYAKANGKVGQKP